MLPLRGALDLGTNSIQLLVGRKAGEGWEAVHEWAAVTRLGEDVQRTGRLRPEAMERTLDQVGRFFAEARARFPGLVGTAAGTSALRDAANRDEFLGACRSRFGFVPRVLAGREEAETTFLGVATVAAPETPLLNLDIGGGSTEISAGIRGECRLAASLDLGCVRLGERFGLLGASTRVARDRARRAARDLLEPALRQAPAAILVSASGGTATTLAATAQALAAYDAGRVEGWETTAADVHAWAERLGQMDLAQRAALPCVNAGRALVLPAGLLVLDAALACLGAVRARVTTRGLRAGMLVRLDRGTLPECWRLDTMETERDG